MSDDSLIQPSLFKHVPSITTMWTQLDDEDTPHSTRLRRVCERLHFRLHTGGWQTDPDVLELGECLKERP